MSDLSAYAADQFADWLSQGSIDAAPSNIYVGLFNTSDSEVSGDFANDRVETTAGTDWDYIDAEQTNFENANDIDFGEAVGDVNDIEDVALFDDTLANGGNLLARYTITDSPFDVADGSKNIFEAGELEFDVLQR